MLVEITIRIDGREVETVVGEVTGTPAEREERTHALGRQVGHRVAQAALEQAAAQARHPACCGHPMQNKGRVRITVRGLDGDLRIARTRYRCGRCGREQYAADGLLLCGRHRVTRPLAKRVCQLAAIEHFTQLPQLVFDQHGVRLSHEELLALAHDVGGEADRLRRAEVEVWRSTPAAQRTWPTAEVRPHRVYVSCDGIMYCTNLREPDPQHPGQERLIWQQMRVGCVYWQDEREVWHKEVVWGRESAEEFGASLFRVACRCGYREAAERLFVADGGDWCWQIQRQYFADAVGIVDWYHVSEHVWACAKVLAPDDPAAWARSALEQLHERGGWGLRQWLQPQRSALRGARRAAVDALLGYVHPREARMDYPRYRRRDWQIGSGMIESTARQLVGLRLKGPGMHWSEAGAIAVTALRAHTINHHWHQFWNTLVLNC
jgi:hypothetical protein